MLRLLTLVALAGVPLAASAQKPLFRPGPQVAVGRGGGTLLVADLDRDGRPDLVSRHLEPRFIAVLRGNGRGGFSPFPGGRIDLDYMPGDSRLGDMNGDGIPDLVVTHNRRDLVDVLLGDGRGQFRRAAGSPVRASPATDSLNKRTLHLADLDGDGDLDAVTANGRRLGRLSTLLGDGRGRLTAGPAIELDSGQDGYSIDVGDVSGDGRPDVVAVSRASFAPDATGRLIVLVGTGGGRFAPAPGSPFATPRGPSRIALGDMDRDGRPDVLVTHANGAITTWRSAGEGRLVRAPRWDSQLGEVAYSPVIADLNGDGHSDVAVATVSSVSVLLGGDALRPAPGSPYRAGPGAYYVAAADLNGDGKLDLLSSSFEADRVSILLAR